MSSFFPMKINNKDQTSKSLPPDQKNQFPVKAPNAKLREDTSRTYLVKCVSSMPLAFQTSKEQLRINYLHSKSQGKMMPDNRFNQPSMIPQSQAPIGLPRMAPVPNISQGQAPSQAVATGTNPFIKNMQQFQGQKQYNPLIPGSQVNNNMFTRQNNNMPLTNNINKNPFIPNNQFQNNQNQYQSRHMFGVTTPAQTGPGLVRQTSFGSVAQTQAPSFVSPTNPLAPNQPLQQQNQPFQQQSTGIFGKPAGSAPVGQTGLQVPGQLTNSPSFGNLGQVTQTQTSQFGQPQKPQGIFGAQTGNQPQSVFPTTLPQTNVQGQPLINQAQPVSAGLDANIKQLLQSKPNLWNILALDPDFKHGFNEHGRIYVKSVLQRIIDENIISGESLNKIIIQIYKQMYGPENFQKMLQSKKNQLKSFDQSKTKTDLMSAKQLHDNNVKSVFPEDINALGDDFYRSFKRIPAKSRDSKILLNRDDNDDDKFRLQRKFYQVKRPQKPLQVKFKFIEIKKPADKKAESAYSPESLQKIAENICEIRKQQRRQIMPTQDDLPNVDGFSIIPSFDTIRTYTKHELLSVPKVTISNEWGSVRFKAPISLLRKSLKQCIIINQKTVQIIDEEWKVREAQITFKKFADFSVLQEEEQNQLEEKINSWCEKQRFELVKVDRERGQVVIEI